MRMSDWSSDVCSSDLRGRFHRPGTCGCGPSTGSVMDIRKDFIDSIGHTPLIRLKHASESTGCEIYGKAEFMNPGGSVKDRAALFIVQDAIRRGALKPGGTIVEGTAGNTGLGLAPEIGRASCRERVCQHV